VELKKEPWAIAWGFSLACTQRSTKAPLALTMGHGEMTGRLISEECGSYLQPESFAEWVYPGNGQGLCGETSLEQVGRQIADRATFLGAAVL
jgi:hypothetical protein